MSNTVHSIEIRNLWKKYDFFWENLNPDVNILIGINGSGKTTLFNIIDSIMMADVKRLRIYGVGVKITIDDYTVDFQQKMTAGELKTALRNVKYQKISTFDVPFRDRPKAGKEYSQLYNELHTIVYDIGGSNPSFSDYRLKATNFPEEAGRINQRIKTLFETVDRLFCQNTEDHSNRSAYQSSDLYRRWRSDTALQTIIRGKAVVADSDACIPDGRTALHPLDGRT